MHSPHEPSVVFSTACLCFGTFVCYPRALLYYTNVENVNVPSLSQTRRHRSEPHISLQCSRTSAEDTISGVNPNTLLRGFTRQAMNSS